MQGLQVHNWLWVRPLSEATQLHWDMEITGMHFTVMLWGLGSSYRLFWRWKVSQELRSQAFDFIPGAQCRRISNVVKCFRNTFFSWTSTQYISICFFPGKSLMDSACPFRSFRAWIAFSGLKKHFMIYFIYKCKMAWETSTVFWQIVKPEGSVHVWPHWIQQW